MHQALLHKLTLRILALASSALLAASIGTATLDAANTPPTISIIDDRIMPIGTPTGPIAFTIADAETAPDDLLLSATSANTTLVPQTNIVFGGAGSSRTLTVFPVPNTIGRASILIRVADPHDGVSFEEFVLWVSSPGHIPTITPIADQTTQEDQPAVVRFSILDTETAVSNLVLLVTSSNPALIPNTAPAIVTSVNPASGAVTLTLSPLTNAHGSAAITVRVTDRDLALSQRVFTLTVRPVDDPPSISDIPDQHLIEGDLPPPIPFTLTDDNPPENLTLTVASSDEELVPLQNILLGGDSTHRTLIVVPAPERTGIVTITLTVRDGATNTGSASFQLEVVPRNQPPQISPVADIHLLPGTQSALVPFTLSDDLTPPGSLSFEWTSEDVLLLPRANVLLGNDGRGHVTLVVLAPPGRQGIAILRLSAADAEGLTNELRVSIAIEIPSPAVQRSGTELALSWPAWAKGLELHETDSLELEATWTPSAAVLTETSAGFESRISIAPGMRFFRLAQPAPR